MTTTASRSALLVLAATLLGPGCSDGPGPIGVAPVPGELAVLLATPAASSDGAALLVITGADLPAPETVRAADPEGVVLFVRAAPNALRLAVFGEVSSGALVVFPTPDVNGAERYTVTLLEVADRDHALREEIGADSVSVSRHEN